ncbi:hypothetical protein FLO80_19480 [Aquicoccus porphyridii]|uniref:DUF680 domain-containing protein n=2 Tax=Aquicoccus porphyridii TaxID=1852029 RepID=A0A5A9YYB4_9RHOB|nr:hypothetical protein FLO80_19480 [Aquicoccus porphyridii]RAI52852.1 hypothetical protein DOO74_15285 [Rhodobacteraceae bacterium AsT-22]
MKLALTALATTIALATGASAMVGPYERAVNDNQAGLFTQGAQTQTGVETQSDSPEADYAIGGEKQITVFSANASDTRSFNGYEGR